MTDLDLSVHPAAREAAWDVVRTLGYVIYPDGEQPAPPALSPGRSCWRALAPAAIERVELDLRWGVEPVDRLLSRPGAPLPESVWHAVDRNGPLPAPSVGHHVALLVHHLIRHDLLHAKGVLDLVLTLAALTAADWASALELAERLKVRRPLLLMAAALREAFAVPDAELPLPEPGGWPAALVWHRLDPVRWLAAIDAADTRETAMITPGRFVRRWLLADHTGAIVSLARDALVPPAAYLRWRWPEERSLASAWRRHAARVGRKLLARSRH